MSTTIIATRLKALREQRGLSQEQLAQSLGFNNRQTLQAIESGERKVAADELVRAGEVFRVALDTFTDPFLLLGEGAFSWRQSGVRASDLDAYERTAGGLVAAYRTLAPMVGRPPRLIRPSLALDKTSTYEDAAAAGERFAAEYELGEVPAHRLAEVMERELGILTLMVDPIEGVSGAACRLPDLDAVLINRNEVPGRRHFDLAHELFHILTWEAMPPEHVEDVAPTRRSRVEQLADNFASAVLMPADVVGRMAPWGELTGDGLIDRLNAAADALGVSASALGWRLVSLGYLTRSARRALPEDRLRHNGRAAPREEATPPLFSRTFVEVIALAIDDGRVSVRRAERLIALSGDELADLCKLYDVAVPDVL